MFELRTLGTAAIHDARGGHVAASPKPLALLVYLALVQPQGPQQRDTLLALFYPELDRRHARTSLRQLVHALREVVGEAVRSDRSTVSLVPGLLTSDVGGFEAALAAGDHAAAVAAYGGPFLQGFFLSGCPGFEQWMESQRRRLKRAYHGALERVALACDAAGDAAEAVRWWRRLAEEDPYATRVTVRLVAALEVAGDRAGALQAADRHAQLLREELEADPSPEVEALARRMRVQPVLRAPEARGSTRERLAAAVAGRYRVTGVAGAGGMALVYRAEDLKLGRTVALKVLRPELAAAIGHERFLNEVDIAAGLSHPNILPLHDVGEADGLLYYVMPYVEGESLRARIAREGPLGLAETVRIALEVAEALAYAHGRGIVHRDIKPANILLLADHAVVSDFGVARAVGKVIEEPALMAATGTPAYMSPEQAAGSPDVDARTDLYSLGCVAFEMLTGAPPDPDTDPAAALATGPRPAPAGTSQAREAVPRSVQTALSGVLVRNPADRFRTAEEFIAALKTDGRSRPAWRRRFAPLAMAAAAAAVLLALGAAVRELTRPFTVTAGIPRRVTSDSDLERSPTLSPDGSEIAYVVGDTSLQLQSLSGGSPVHLADQAAGGLRWSPEGDRIFFGGWTGRGSLFAIKEVSRTGGPVRILERPYGHAPAISPDGTRIAYWQTLDDGGRGIFIDSVGGGRERGAPVAIIPVRGLVHSLAWSPDGRKIAYVGSPRRTDPGSRALIANELATSAIFVMFEDGQTVQVTEDAHRDMRPAWLPDNRHLLFVSDRDGPRDVYVVDVEDPGEPQRVTFGEDPGYLSLSADGRRLAYSKLRFRRNIWSVPIPARGTVSLREGRAVTAVAWDQTVVWHDLSPAGDSIAFDLRDTPGGVSHIYKMALAGGAPVQLTSYTASDYRPTWSPDGREIAFAREAGDRVELWVMDADGGNQRLEAEALGGRQSFDWSSDGLRLIYERGAEGLWAVSRDSVRQGYDEPVEFGEPARWYEEECQLPRRIPNRSGMICNALHEDSPLEPFASLLWLSARGQVRRRYDPTPFREAVPRFNAALRDSTVDPHILWWTRHPRYSPDGSMLYFFGNPGGEVLLMSLSAAGGEPRPLVHVQPRPITAWVPRNDGRGEGAFSVGRDAFYFSVGEWDGDIWVVDLQW